MSEQHAIYLPRFELASSRLARAAAAAVPMLVMAYPVLIWPLLFAEPVYTAAFDYLPPQPSPGEGVLVTFLFVPALFLVSLAAFAVAPPELSRAERRTYLWFAAFFLLAGVSVTWSLDPVHSLTKFVRQLLLFGALALSVSTARDARRVLLLVFAMLAVAVALNGVMVLSRPPGLIGHEGIYSHKNTLGSVSAIAFLFSLYVLASSRGVVRLAAFAVLLGCVLLLVKSESKTALIVAAIAPAAGLLIHALTSRTGRSPSLLLAGLLSLILSAYFAASLLFDFEFSDVLQLVFNDKTFTGRTDIWAFVWGHVVDRPVFGYGYHGFWQIADSPKATAPLGFIAKMPHGHNGYLDTLLTLGMVGLLPYFAIITNALKNCGRRVMQAGALSWMLISLLLMFLIINAMESVILLTGDADNVAFILAACLAASTAGLSAVPERHRSAAWAVEREPG